MRILPVTLNVATLVEIYFALFCIHFHMFESRNYLNNPLIINYPIYWQIKNKIKIASIESINRNSDGDIHRMQFLTMFLQNSKNFSEFMKSWLIWLQKAWIHLRSICHKCERTFPFSRAKYTYIHIVNLISVNTGVL